MIKIEVVSGFLGAGKTTFIQQMIKSNIFENETVVIIENEYGEVNLDAKLLKNCKIPVYEITKGCLCCALKDDFVTTLIEIKSIQPDRVIIEPSGIFMLETLTDLLRSQTLEHSYALNSVTSILDVMLFERSFIPMIQLIETQIKHADNIVLSKAVDSSGEAVKRAINFAKQNNPNSPIYDRLELERNHTGLRQLFDAPTQDRVTQLHKSPCHKQAKHVEVDTITVNTKVKLSKNRFDSFISTLNQAKLGDILRIKGFVDVEGDTIECQYAGGHLSYQKTVSAQEYQMVFIGHGLKHDKIKRCFEQY